ncbi:restriction endonuclease [Clostridium tagluense]|uniref:restriction endonuclease n=1 Tax=Clostridium tagluense TaxID=360422 RepID=UPI001CF3DEB6|nr:restriction endonuclease [Clostridium tagluense]MCB2299862.1 restriction endonuclease [Clostridium tagluense]
MSDYDFKQLSSYDFEILIRDLLQEEYGVILESFKQGRDNGIDLRYTEGEECRLIVQCKNFANSLFSDLKKVLNQETIKISKLKFQRYILATSIGLTPSRKDKIFEILKP